MGIIEDPLNHSPFRARHPRDDEGRLCLFAVRGAQGSTLYAPTLPEALTAVMGPGYASLGAPERAALRLVRAIEVAERVQRSVERTGHMPTGALEQLERPKDRPLENVGEWTWRTPLVLVDALYYPFGPPAPTGRVLWVNAVDEWQFALSLAVLDGAVVAARV